MRILILSQWYYPENVSGKINSIGKEFIKQVHKVKCFTGFPNYPNGEIFNEYKLSLWRREQIDSIEIIRFPSFIDHSKNKINRIFNYISLAISSTFLAPFFIGKPDVIFLYDSLLSMGLPCLIFSKIKNFQ